MTLLHIALQEGFVKDSVILSINGEKVFEKSHIQSQWPIGYAGEVELHIAEGPTTIEVIILSRTESKSISLNIWKTTYLGLSLTARDLITYKVSHSPFEYL